MKFIVDPISKSDDKYINRKAEQENEHELYGISQKQVYFGEQ